MQSKITKKNIYSRKSPLQDAANKSLVASNDKFFPHLFLSNDQICAHKKKSKIKEETRKKRAVEC
jgi:hypothetical protein